MTTTNQIREIYYANATLYFVADDLGSPVSFGYPTREQAEHVAELIETSDGQASIPLGVDVEKIYADCRLNAKIPVSYPYDIRRSE